MNQTETIIQERNRLLTRIENLERQLAAAEKVLEDWGHYDEYERLARPPFHPAM